MHVLVTGGAGYIGSHTALCLLEAGHSAVVLDDLSAGSAESVRRVAELSGKALPLVRADVCDPAALQQLFSQHSFDAVIHLAGLKAVGESVRQPLCYYRRNLDGTLNLLECMHRSGVRTLVFSSSATVYGTLAPSPYTEGTPLGPCSNPYGWTKLMQEQIIRDHCLADEAFSAVSLRYFNPVGAHPSGLIGEDPKGIPNNLMPYLTRAAAGLLPKLQVFGGDYPTPDGSCLRDYLHVMDLAEGHVRALEYAAGRRGEDAVNLGTGRPTSVLALLEAFREATGVAVPWEMGPRRAGDLPAFWANPEKAERLLGWTSRRSIEEMCRDAWNWQQKNPHGYQA